MSLSLDSTHDHLTARKGIQDAQKQKRIIHRYHGTGYYEIKYQIRGVEHAQNYIPYKTASGSSSLATQSHHFEILYVLRTLLNGFVIKKNKDGLRCEQ